MSPSKRRLKAFPPVLGECPETLILGSMPSEESLRQSRYYAHPQNAFWPIMGALLGFAPDTPYLERLEILKARKIALWDVLESCVRPGSMDSDIEGEIPNDFKTLFKANPQIRRVAFNGATAEKLFLKHAAAFAPHGCALAKAPSSSPAFASMRFERKLELWKNALGL